MDMLAALRRAHLSGRLKIALIIFAAAVLLAVYIVHKFNSPAEGTIGGSQAHPAQSTTTPKTGSGHFEGKYLSFDYPTDYKDTKMGLSGSFLEVFRAYSPARTDRHISIGLQREALDSDAGVNYRQKHPELYRLESSPPDQTAFVSRQNGLERVVYISRGGLVLSITGYDAMGYDMKPELDKLINSLKWK